MSKRKTVLPARKRRHRSRDDDSLLLRSAESLGRVIGALQRELDKAARRIAADSDRVTDSDGATPRAKTLSGRTGHAKAAKKTAQAKRKTTAKAKRTVRAAATASRTKAASRAAGGGRRSGHDG